MPENSCTPENVVAKLAAVFEAGGIPTTEKAFEAMTENGKALYHQSLAKGGSEVIDAAKPELLKKTDELIDDFLETETPEGKKGLKQRISGGLLQVMKPEDFMPKEVTEPVFQYLDNFFSDNHNNLGQARQAYKAGIRQVINEIDLDKLNPSIKGEVLHWTRDLLDGYPFYKKQGTFLEGWKSNIISNTLDFSGTILLGNPLEFLVKSPAVYGFKPTVKGVSLALKESNNNIWAKIPEVEKAGGYGIKIPEKSSSSLKKAYTFINDKVMGITDTPLKNVAYYTGKSTDGKVSSGAQAIEKIAFKNRWGNDPRLGRSSKDAITLMNYTMNTYHMLGGMGKAILTPSKRIEGVRQLGTWIALTSAIGGPAAVIPAPLSAILRSNDEYKEWEDSHLNTLGKLVRPGGITFGLGYELINRAGDAWQGGLKKGASKFSNGDTIGGILDLGEGGLSAMTVLSRNPLGNVRVQKLLRNTRDLFEGDIDFEEYTQKAKETALPALKINR